MKGIGMGWNDERIHQDHPLATILIVAVLIGSAVFMALVLCGVIHA